MNYVTDFADQAVMLQVIVVMALTLGVLGWWRGAVAWLLAVGASFATVLVLKLLFVACGPALGVPALRSPSGHAAAAAILAGGVAVVMGTSRRRVAAVAGLAALVIGATRLALGLHTTTEVIVGGVLGVAGAVGFARTAGPEPALRLRWLFVVMMVVTLLLHGHHLNAEAHIRAATAALRVCTDA